MAARPAVGLAPEMRTSIAERAYYKAEQRGFMPGHELDDWLAAEQEVSAAVAERESAPAATKTKKPGSRKRAAT